MTYIQDPIIKDIPGYPRYQISENGEVYNKITGFAHKNHINKEYVKCSLYRKSRYIHKLLGLAFIENPDNKPYIDHIDRNKSNNNLNNLRWATHSENMRNTKAIGVCKHSSICNNKRYDYWAASLSCENVKEYKKFPYTDEGYKLALEWRKSKEKEHYKDFSPQ